MKNTTLALLLISLLFTSCFVSIEDSAVEEKQDKEEEETFQSIKKDYYITKMKEKNFSLLVNGPCDDALADTLYERYVPYIDSQMINDFKITIEFKFKDACCQEFLGDYHINNDTLIYEFEQVNEGACTCICWYHYKLEVNDIKQKITGVKIEKKK